MKKIITINLNKEFKRAYFKGAFKVHPYLTTYMVKNYIKPTSNRIGITTSKKIGNAVQRNRSRRIIRAAYCMLKNDLPIGYDFVFVARKDTKLIKSTDIYTVMNSHINFLQQRMKKK